MSVTLLLAAAACLLAAGVLAAWHRHRVTTAWRRRLALATTHARRLRRAASTGDHARVTATMACTSMLQFAQERAALGLLPSPGRRRHHERAALESAADELLARLAALARDTPDAG